MKTSKILSLLVITLTLTSNSFIEASPQDKKKSDQEIKLRAELVQIDVLVTDKNNKPVSGLKREDFELFDNGKPQTISNFSYEEAKNSRIEASKDATLPRSITAGELHRVIAFVVDTLHLNIYSVYRTRKMLEDFVANRMEPGDLVLIFPTGGGSGLLQQFTTDRKLLSRAISRLRPLYYSTDSTPRRNLELTRSAGGSGPVSRVPGALSMPDQGNSAAEEIFETMDVRDTLRTLDDVIKAMGKMRGRKISVFVSQGFRLRSTQSKDRMGQTTALAARNNVVFYSIDPNGLDITGIEGYGADFDDGQGNSFNVTTSTAMTQRRFDSIEARESLGILASDTGGKFFRNNNDILTGLNNLMEENSAYYMLGFQPESEQWDGKFHKIKVTLRNRPDLTVSFRKGYVAKSDKPEAQSKFSPHVAEVMEVIASPLAQRDIDLKLTPLYIDSPQRDAVVTILLHIDASRLSFKRVEDRHKTVLEQVGFIFDAEGKTVDYFAHDLDLDLKPQTYETALKQGLVATRRLSLKPGLYQAKLFVRDKESGLTGTANDYFDVPNMKGDRMVLSSLFTSGQATGQSQGDAVGEGGTLSNRNFRRNGEIAYSLVIYNAKTQGNNKQTQLELKTRILKGSKAVFDGATRPVQIGEGSMPPNRIVTGGTLQLRALEPGDYTLEVTVMDRLRKKASGGTMRQEIDFSVQ